MPLDKQLLVSEIRKINDPTFVDFVEWPMSFNEACERWSEAIRLYSELILPYSPSSTSEALNLAKESMKSFLMSSGNVQGNIFENSIQQFAQVFASTPNETWTGVPPSSILNLSQIKSRGMSGASAESVAVELSDKIHEWFLTGTAINISTGISVNWS